MSKISKKNQDRLTAKELHNHLAYDSKTGIFTWRKRKWRSAKGKAGSLHPHGYIVITIDEVQYPAHRLAWLYHFGNWPIGELDHRDTKRSNNAIKNLREATPLQNRANARSKLKNGIKGVRKKWKNWEASIVCQGRYFYLGTHKTKLAASRAYLKKAKELHGEFARAA
jgi:hypothetical protein